MNILVLTPIIPYPPHDGDKLRLFHFLKYLKGRGHALDLFCLTRVKSDLQFASDLRPLCRRLYTQHLTNAELFFNLIGGLLMGQSLNVSSHFSPELRDALQAYWKTQDGKGINVILAHRLRSAPAVFDKNPGKPVVLELTDSLTAIAEQMKGQKGIRFSRRLAAGWDRMFLRHEEPGWGSQSSKTVVISGKDAEVLKENGLPPEKVEVIPNGVEVKPSGSKRPDLYDPDRPVAAFVGNMGYAPNEEGALWFLKRVWPHVKRDVPQAVFAAVGGQPRRVLRKFHNGQDVFVTGWVPQIEPYLKYAVLSIAPLRVAAGMQNKVALSLAMGVPVVATPAALSWLPPQGREGAIVAPSEGLFAQEVAEVLLRPKKVRDQAAKGRRYVLKHYRWNESGRKLEKILKEASKGNF